MNQRLRKRLSLHESSWPFSSRLNSRSSGEKGLKSAQLRSMRTRHVKFAAPRTLRASRHHLRLLATLNTSSELFPPLMSNCLTAAYHIVFALRVHHRVLSD